SQDLADGTDRHDDFGEFFFQDCVHGLFSLSEFNILGTSLNRMLKPSALRPRVSPRSQTPVWERLSAKLCFAHRGSLQPETEFRSERSQTEFGNEEKSSGDDSRWIIKQAILRAGVCVDRWAGMVRQTLLSFAAAAASPQVRSIRFDERRRPHGPCRR